MTRQHPFQNEELALELFLTPPHPCGYLEEHNGATLFVNPETPMDAPRYEQLMSIGFRRSGNIVYRPWCAGCTACVPVRLPVERFVYSRAFRRVVKRNQNLTVHQEEPAFTAERFALYRRYLLERHGDGPMANPTPEEFEEFLLCRWNAVRFVDFRLQGRLVMTAVLDRLPSSLSAVYCFYDPDETHRSPGTYAILWEIEQARQLGLTWLYLGYWIGDSPKMRYKSRFQPMEAYLMRQWRPMPPEGC